MKKLQAICMALALTLAPVLAEASPMQSFSSEQRKEIERMVRELLVKEPAIVIEAAQAYQEQAEKRASVQSAKALKTSSKEIFENPTSPSIGNKKGDVTVVEFFDYACGYCKKVQPSILKLLKTDKNVRVVFKELPIFGPSSLKVSKAALASDRQGKYFEFHTALMSERGRISDSKLISVAKKVGLDIDKLKKDMDDPKIEQIIKDNQELAGKLGISGTPAFIINDEIFAGAIPYKDMKVKIADLRKAK